LKVKLTPQNNVFKPTGPFIPTTWKILFSKLKMITQPLNSAIKQEHKTYKLTIVKKKRTNHLEVTITKNQKVLRAIVFTVVIHVLILKLYL